MRAQIIWLGACLLAGCAAERYSDPGPMATDAGDLTALLVGCDSVTPASHLFCRFPAGWQPTGDVFVAVPPIDCPAASCANVVVLAPDVSKVYDEPVPKGATWARVPWTALVGRTPLDPQKRGFWPVVLRWSWADPDTGVVFQSIAEGEIRLRVYRTDGGYTPLAFDPSTFTWSWKAKVNGQMYNFGMTDHGRSVMRLDK